MVSELRKTGLSIVGDVPWGTHFCHFYETKQDLLDTLVPYFKAGLESKEFCLWVVSNSELITVEEAKSALAQAVPDLDRHLAEGNIEILNGPDWYLEENVFNLDRVTSAWNAKLKRALARGYDGMRASGDTFWLTEKNWKDFYAYEKEVNDSIIGRPMNLLCTYPLTKSGAAEVLDVAQVHQFVIARRQGEWEVIETQEPIQAKSEIKRLNEALQRSQERERKQPLIFSYGMAVLSVAAALISARMLDVHMASAPASLFLCALMFSCWYGGVKPGLLAMVLSFLAFKFYFVAPIYSLTVGVNSLPRYLIFVLASIFVIALSAAQRNSAESLRRARDVLDGTVRELKRTNQALRAEITERKRAETLLHAKEQEFRAIVENAPDQIIRYDREFRRMYVNPAVAHLYGLPAEALIGKPLGSGIRDSEVDVTEDELAQFRQRIKAVFDTGESYEFEMGSPMPTGRGYYSLRLFPELDLNGSVINVLGIARDITESKQAEEKLKATSEQLRALSARLQSAREEEGTRIARELHDELGSALTSLRWGLDEIDSILSTATKTDADTLRKKIATMTTLVEGTLNTVRKISSELRPGILDDLGLVAAIEWQTQQFQARTGIICDCDCPLESVGLSKEQSTAVFRIFQEALTNILRHAQATRVDIEINKDNGYFVLSVRDNGKGITERERLGILGMRERAHLIGGEITIKGVEGKGTVVIVRVPISGQDMVLKMTR